MTSPSRTFEPSFAVSGFTSIHECHQVILVTGSDSSSIHGRLA